VLVDDDGTARAGVDPRRLGGAVNVSSSGEER
jgi:hypothetical protein